ncbi:low-density lipoprotein receptor-related protein 4 isoform X3 [Magallana gigas]|uniref:low-density lipoprotein receptor-related protein 4 isoform X3 n=1 Tax=Magallana gigas TaxID=29159 RepID=UPI0033405BDB
MMLLLLGTLFLLEHFCFGFLSEQGLIVGMHNPASIKEVTENPENSTSPFSVADLLTIYPSDIKITSLASDPNKGVFFVAQNNTIFIWQDDHEVPNFSTVYNKMYAEIEQIAFDYITGNLYWCDSLHNWIALKPAYDFREMIFKVVIQKDLYNPKGLALDPEDGLMFFSDNGPNPRIERASLDGQDRVVIVYRGILRVVSLTVDTDNDKLYWADHDRQTLEGCDYDGSNRRVIRRMNEVPLSSLIYHEDSLYVVSLNTMNLYEIDITSDALLDISKFPSGQPYTVNVYHTESTKSFKDPCLTLHCDHICINTKSGPTCVCSDGFELNRDGKTCTDISYIMDGMFIVSNASMFAMHRLHSVDGQRSVLHSVQLPVTNIETFDVDTKTKTIYFVDGGSRSLKKHDIVSLITNTLTSVSSATVTDLSFDWISKRLGWIEPTLSSIRSFSINAQASATVYTNLQEPTSLTIDPHNGVLYWISGTSVRTIVQGSWTRDIPQVLITAANLHNPTSLQFDVKTNRLYWLDRSVIKSSMTNGRDIKSHINTKGAIKTIAYKDFFGWINKKEIYFARSIFKNADITFNTVQNAKDIAVFDSTLQEDRRGTCHIQNGHCGGLCVPEENGRRCECDIGLHLQKDQSCDNDVLLSNFIVVTDFTHGRILQVDFQTGTVIKLPITANRSPGLVLEKSTTTLFYCETFTKSIKYTTLQGDNTTYFYTTGSSYADRLAIDYSTGNLYYTAVGPTTSQSYIGVVHRSTSLHKTLIYNLHSPKDIALYSSKGYVFWTEFGNTAQIVRANMDGTSKSFIAKKQIGWPNGLTLDFKTNRLYWTDGYYNRIESSDLNAGNRQVLATDNDAHLMSIVIHGQFLYYTAWNRQRITKINKITGLKVPFMLDYPEIGRLDSLDIYTDDIRDVSSSCSNLNGLCSTFCFPTPNGRTCGCQDNVKLQSDQLTCEGDVRRCIIP